MKKSELVKIIREAVRAEIKVVLKEILGAKKSNITEFSNTMSHAETLFKPKKSKKTKKIAKQQFTENSVLNDVLNETANQTEWPTMGGKTLSANSAPAGKSGLAAAMGLGNMDETFGGKPSAQQMLPADRQHVEVPKDVEKALTRDYSDLMKAINKKKK